MSSKLQTKDEELLEIVLDQASSVLKNLRYADASYNAGLIEGEFGMSGRADSTGVTAAQYEEVTIDGEQRIEKFVKSVCKLCYRFKEMLEASKTEHHRCHRRVNQLLKKMRGLGDEINRLQGRDRTEYER